MKHIRGGGSHGAARRDKNVNKAATAGSGDEGKAKLSQTQSQRKLSATQSQKLSQTQSQKAISSTQSQPKVTIAEKTAESAALAAKKRIIHICIAAAVAVFIISIALVLRAAGEEKSYQTYYAQASSCYAAADYEGALVYLRKAISLNETDESLLLMTDCYLACGNMEKALEILRTMDVKDPEIADKIDSIEKARRDAQAAQKVTVAGEQYPADAKSLVLDGMGIGNNALREIAQLYTLNNLSLANNGISDIEPLSSLGGLTTLNLSGNSVSDLSSLANLTGLRTLYLDSNPVESFEPIYTLTNLSTLSIKDIEISDTELEALSQALPGCAIHWEAEEEDVLEISFGGVSFSSDVTEVSLSNLGITDISVLSSCTNLKSLDLSGNYISDISPLMDIPGLEWLSIENNRVTDLRPLMGVTSLKVINAENNEISNIAALGSLTELEELYLGGNRITDFSVLGKLQELSTLGLENTGLNDEGLANVMEIPDLRILMLEGNPDITGNVVDEFKQSNFQCKVYHDDLVYVVELGGKLFREDVTELDAAYMGLTDISCLSGFDRVEYVNLSGNSINNIYCFQWMTAVKKLNLSDNDLVDITALAYLDGLEVVDLSNNKLLSVTPLYFLDSLKEVHLSGNGLSEHQINELKAYQPGIIVYTD